MTLSLDLNALSPAEFQTLCWRLVQREYPDAVLLNINSWDGGRDVVSLGTPGNADFVFQCKWMRETRLADLKRAVRKSLDALKPTSPIAIWTLCLSKDPTGPFLDWLRPTLDEFRFIRGWRIWGAAEIVRRVEQEPDILQSTFLTQYLAWQQRFHTDQLELIEMLVEPGTGWQMCAEGTARFAQQIGANSDLVLGITVRNRGTLATALRQLTLEARHVRRHLRGLPGEGLLHTQVIYSAPLSNGNPDPQPRRLNPKLEVLPGRHAQFAIRLYDTGYAWSGSVRILLTYAQDKQLALPWMHLRA